MPPLIHVNLVHIIVSLVLIPHSVSPVSNSIILIELIINANYAHMAVRSVILRLHARHVKKGYV